MRRQTQEAGHVGVHDEDGRRAVRRDGEPATSLAESPHRAVAGAGDRGWAAGRSLWTRACPWRDHLRHAEGHGGPGNKQRPAAGADRGSRSDTRAPLCNHRSKARSTFAVLAPLAQRALPADIALPVRTCPASRVLPLRVVRRPPTPELLRPRLLRTGRRPGRSGPRPVTRRSARNPQSTPRLSRHTTPRATSPRPTGTRVTICHGFPDDPVAAPCDGAIGAAERVRHATRTLRPHRALNQASPLGVLPDPIDDDVKVIRRDRLGGSSTNMPRSHEVTEFRAPQAHRPPILTSITPAYRLLESWRGGVARQHPDGRSEPHELARDRSSQGACRHELTGGHYSRPPRRGNGRLRPQRQSRQHLAGYDADLRHFASWCNHEGPPAPLPAAAATVAASTSPLTPRRLLCRRYGGGWPQSASYTRRPDTKRWPADQGGRSEAVWSGIRRVHGVAPKRSGPPGRK
jgi:hypothetical protein